MKNGILQLRLSYLDDFSELLPAGVHFQFDAALHALEEEIDRQISQAREQGHYEQRLATFKAELKEDKPDEL